MEVEVAVEPQPWAKPGSIEVCEDGVLRAISADTGVLASIVCPYPVGARVGVLEPWKPECRAGVFGIGFRADDAFFACSQGLQRASIAAKCRAGHSYCRWQSAASLPLWAIRTHVLVTQSDARVVDGRAVWVVTVKLAPSPNNVEVQDGK